jgi:hypothetical protein
MNTRAAFDALNGMFGGGDDTTTMHGLGRPAAAAAGRRSIAAADAGGVTMNTRAAFDAMNGMFGGDDTTTMHGFGRAAAAGIGMEPTVTVNTRAAFDYMNGVFGGPGDVTMGQTAAITGRKVQTDPLLDCALACPQSHCQHILAVHVSTAPLSATVACSAVTCVCMKSCMYQQRHCQHSHSCLQCIHCSDQ